MIQSKKMLIASSSKDVKFHTWPDGNLIHCYKPSLTKVEGPVRSISWGKDGTWLVLVPCKGQAEVISIKDSLKHLHTIHEIQQPTCAAFQNATKKNIALGTMTGQVLVYDIKNKLSRKRFPKACGSISQIEYCAKDTHLVAACETGEVLLYNNTNCVLAASYKIPDAKTITALRCHPNKRALIAGGSEEGIVAVWDINAGKIKGCIQAHAAPVTDVAFSPIRFDLLVSLGMDRKFGFYDIVSGSMVFEFSVERALTAVDFCSDGISLAVASLDGKIHHYDTRNMKEPQSTFIGHHGPVRNLLFQKLTAEDTGILILPEDVSEPHFQNYIEKSNINPVFDSFGHMISGDRIDEISDDQSSQSTAPDSNPAADSFMVAMGLTNTPSGHQEVNLGISEAVKKALRDKPNVFEMASSKTLIQHMSPIPYTVKTTINDQKQGVDSYQYISSQPQSSNITSSYTVKPISSTPKISTITPDTLQPDQNQNLMQANCSPQSSHQNIPTIDFQQIRDILRDEIRSEIQAMKVELRHEFIDVYANMRRQFLDMQMSMVKEFVQLENVLNRLRDDLTIDEGSEDELILQENIRMRRELALLTEKLRQKED